MATWWIALCVAAMGLMGLALAAAADETPEPPPPPIGLDAYRQWDRWPYQRIGVRAIMRSTYDRTGANHHADASHFLRQEAEDFNVTLDVVGPGVLAFVRTNHWHGSPWHYVVDGRDHIIQETSTADPEHPVEGSRFLPEGLLPEPLAWTWSTTRGADLNWVPAPFRRELQIAYSRTRYGTGYYIVHQLAPGTPAARSLRPWDGKTPPPADVLGLLARAGSDVAPPAGAPGVEALAGECSLPAGGAVELASLRRAPYMLRALTLSIPEGEAEALSACRLQITWDGRREPSVDAPVPLFFGAGTLYNRDGREHLVKAFPVNIRYAGGRIHLACYFPMPFFRSARVALAAGQRPVAGVQWSLRWEPYEGPASHVGYFHATYRDHPAPARGHDLVLLDTREAEGGGDWCGSFVGTSFIFSHRAVLNTLEGDPRFFFDDSLTPQAQGTGTEEWGGGGDYWGGRNMTLPLAGHPVGAPNARAARDPRDLIQSAYRFLLADLMPFGMRARICLEHGGTNESTEHYETVTYWYGLPGAALVLTDELDIGDGADEAAHGYRSPQASEPYAVTSRYEWGVDRVDGNEVYPAHTDRGRKTRGASEFTLRIDPANLGVMLRRKLDYAYPNQRADVWVADAGGPWRRAGVWYTAGSNTCVFSDPVGELGAAQHVMRTSNRQFRDDEFLLPPALTKGRSSIRVRVRFRPVEKPLYPGRPVGELAWTELRYACYCYVVPPSPP